MIRIFRRLLRLWAHFLRNLRDLELIDLENLEIRTICAKTSRLEIAGRFIAQKKKK